MEKTLIATAAVVIIAATLNFDLLIILKVTATESESFFCDPTVVSM